MTTAAATVALPATAAKARLAAPVALATATASAVEGGIGAAPPPPTRGGSLLSLNMSTTPPPVAMAKSRPAVGSMAVGSVVSPPVSTAKAKPAPAPLPPPPQPPPPPPCAAASLTGNADAFSGGSCCSLFCGFAGKFEAGCVGASACCNVPCACVTRLLARKIRIRADDCALALPGPAGVSQFAQERLAAVFSTSLHCSHVHAKGTRAPAPAPVGWPTAAPASDISAAAAASAHPTSCEPLKTSCGLCCCCCCACCCRCNCCSTFLRNLKK
mmetsp:Transcript_24557/g.56835  ORF Transcript_24557/g.56835 Transcript_24557/m.56835 type:complete len:271 (-) Transcript_24557:196-1008(-)